MLILLPPSEGKAAPGGKGSFEQLHPEWVDDVKGVLAKLKKLSTAERQKWYGQRNPEGARAIHNQNLEALEAPCMKAIERYTGVVYSHIGYPELRGKKSAERRICIVSGLFGLIQGGTGIPSYKLPMNPTLAKYWRPINGERLEAMAKGKPVLSLLPQAHAKALDYPDLIYVDFKVAGGKRSAGHSGKAIKGRFVRFLLEEKVTSPDDIGRFEEDGYRFDGENFVQE